MNTSDPIAYKEIPTIITIFGATGDLSKRKIIPALFDLYSKEMLPPVFRVIGFSRRERSDQDFRAFAKKAIAKKKHNHTRAQINAFLDNFHYHTGFFEDAQSYGALGDYFVSLDEKFKTCSNKLFYLAVPPVSYEVILQNLADSGLTIPCSNEKGWTRVLVEKPFGNDVETAEHLDMLLGLLFKEEQIFRIDHYLAKETIQNILSFRFSNVLFEPTWNNEYIERVEISLHETIGIDGRGPFYDGIGALRDVGQNHLLQMLATIAMENPNSVLAERVRKARAVVLRALHIKKGGVLVRGQYRGYRNVKGVLPKSQSETYFKMEMEVRNSRWRGVPFVLESGKKMEEKKTEINVYFKKTEKCLCPPDAEQHHQNILTFRIQPDEGISVLFWAKKPGFSSVLEPKKMTFLYKQSEEELILPDAYERVFFDCIRGDQTLFTSTEEVKTSWKFIMPILERWKKGGGRLVSYKEGFAGEETDKFVK